MSVQRGSTRHRVRKALLAATVAVGTAALAVSFQVSASLDRVVYAAVEGGGRRIAVANASVNSDGSFDWQMPFAFTPSDKALLVEADVGIKAASIVMGMPWREVEAGGVVYKPGDAMGSDEDYATVMGLKIIAGSFFSASDVRDRVKTMVLSERAAKALYGDPAKALGAGIRVDKGMPQRPGASAGRTAEASYESYTIAGVFKDASAFERDAFSIPDYIIPYTAMMPADMPAIPFARAFQALGDSRDPLRVEAGLRAALAPTKGEDVKVSVWEGSAESRGGNSLARARSALGSLSMVSQLFGFVILIVAGFGIVSGMMAEAADRKREFSIKRAIGLPASDAALELILGGSILAGIGAVIGFALAFLATDWTMAALAPYVAALDIDLAEIGGGFELRSLLAPLAALVLAPLFSALPAVRASSAPITDGLK